MPAVSLPVSATLTSPPIADAPPELSKKDLARQVWKLAIPATGENLLQTALLIVDTAMIAPFGTVALAASSISGVILWRAHMTFGCVERGTTALVARFAGEKAPEKAAQTVAQSIVMALLVGSAMTVFGLLLAPWLLRVMGAKPDVVRAGVPFLQIILLASVPRMIFYVVGASLRGTGDTRTPMWVSLWMNVTNIAFNFIFIYGIPGIIRGRGLTGSAISTALSLTMGAGILLIFAMKGKGFYQIRLAHFSPQWALIGRMLRIAWPSLLEELIITAGYLGFFGFIASFGTDTIAAHTVATGVASLSFMTGVGFAVAAATLVGQSLGQQNIPRARMAFMISAQRCVAVMSVIAIGLVLFGGYITRAFIYDNPEIERMALILLWIAALEQPLLGFCITLGGGLRGAGDTYHPMLTSLVGSAFVRVLACYILAFPLGLGIYGIYWGTVIDWLVRAGVLYYFYKRGHWSRIRI
jgi:putative MATE family efflux protein